jgi:hypothetical protein
LSEAFLRACFFLVQTRRGQRTLLGGLGTQTRRQVGTISGSLGSSFLIARRHGHRVGAAAAARTTVARPVAVAAGLQLQVCAGVPSLLRRFGDAVREVVFVGRHLFGLSGCAPRACVSPVG